MPIERRYKSEEDNAKFIAWHRARAQANFRNENWQLPVEDWFAIWTPTKWRQRGRSSKALCLMRIDADKPWCMDNVKLATRKEQLALQPRADPWWKTQYGKYCSNG